MKRILFITPSLSNGGAEKVVSAVSSGLAKKNVDINILNFYTCEKEYPIDSNVKRFILSNGYEEDYKKINKLKRFVLLRKQIKKINPDYIVCFLDHVCIYTFISSIFSKYLKRIVFTERNNPNFANKKLVKIKSILQKFVKKIIIQNSGQQKTLAKADIKKSYIIPNPINDKYLDYKKELNNQVNHIISIGRLTNQKDYPLALYSFKEVIKKYPNLTYHIFGQGEDKEKIQLLIKELNIENNVILEGFCTDINQIYKDADLFLMTSKYEGMPNALAESLAAGIPSISMDCDFGPCDLIENENMGILIKEHTVDATVDALIKMIENYSYYVAKSNEVKEIMKNKYSLDKISGEWIKVLD